MSPLRGSVLGFNCVLQKCHPYGVEEATGQKWGIRLVLQVYVMPQQLECQKLYTLNKNNLNFAIKYANILL